MGSVYRKGLHTSEPTHTRYGSIGGGQGAFRAEVQCPGCIRSPSQPCRTCVAVHFRVTTLSLLLLLLLLPDLSMFLHDAVLGWPASLGRLFWWTWLGWEDGRFA